MGPLGLFRPIFSANRRGWARSRLCICANLAPQTLTRDEEAQVFRNVSPISKQVSRDGRGDDRRGHGREQRFRVRAHYYDRDRDQRPLSLHPFSNLSG